VLSAAPRAWSPEELSLLGTVAHQAAAAIETARAVMRGLLAREIHHRVKNNLQTVASLLRLQLRSVGDDGAAGKALSDSINRVLSIAAVHDLLTAAREDDIDCADLIGRLEEMLAHGLAGRSVASELESVMLPGASATALALVFSELFSNAVEHGAGQVRVTLARANGGVELVVADGGRGPAPGAQDGLGLTIARALVREELGGRLDLGGGRAVVTFRAGS
jgi:two-component sensor histidine kinase